MDVVGPVPGDTVFVKLRAGQYDAVVAMYHDQGHIPMKLIDFEKTVNVSLGLPIIRTSVDHGTAFDIVGRNIAEPRNMKAAMALAVRLAIGQKKRQSADPVNDSIPTLPQDISEGIL
jgi:4-hydroxythreonine-4-phosphate dehydrogenase